MFCVQISLENRINLCNVGFLAVYSQNTLQLSDILLDEKSPFKNMLGQFQKTEDLLFFGATMLSPKGNVCMTGSRKVIHL